MIRPIYLYGSEVLRQKAAPVNLSEKEHITTLVQDLWDTLKASDGCGLAAPQIGVSERVVVVDGDEVADEYTYLKGFKRALINPVIVDESQKKCEYDEGCLSIPGIYASVVRSESLTVEYYNENLEKVTETFDKFGARMVQHELSHLDGSLFTDLVPPIRRKMLAGKLTKIAHGKVGTQYKSKIR